MTKILPPAYAACAAEVQREQSGPYELCIAVLPDPAVSEVTAFIMPNGECLTSVWNYHLVPWRGCFAISG